MIESGIHEGGAFGAAGLILGAVLAWPRKTVTHQGIFIHTTWHNAFTSSGDLSHVVEIGILMAGVICLLGALLGAAIGKARTPTKTG